MRGESPAVWLPDKSRAPALWLTTSTDQQRAALEAAYWLPNQVALIMMRAGIPHETVKTMRVMVDSEEGQARLMES